PPQLRPHLRPLRIRSLAPLLGPHCPELVPLLPATTAPASRASLCGSAPRPTPATSPPFTWTRALHRPLVTCRPMGHPSTSGYGPSSVARGSSPTTLIQPLPLRGSRLRWSARPPVAPCPGQPLHLRATTGRTSRAI